MVLEDKTNKLLNGLKFQIDLAKRLHYQNDQLGEVLTSAKKNIAALLKLTKTKSITNN